MKPIIVDMKNMSDSTEVYESRPNRFMVYTIYVILAIVVVAFIWMYFFKIDIVVKSNGIFKGSEAVYDISSAVTGRVKETHIQNGQFVNKGDILYVLEVESLSDTIVRYQKELEEANDRLELLSAYEESLDVGITALKSYLENPYYKEFINRRELLFTNISADTDNVEGQTLLYQGNVDSISSSINKHKEKIAKLNAVKQCIISRKNTFSYTENYYFSIVNSYLASYEYTSTQHDNKISEYKRQIDEYDKKISEMENLTVGASFATDIETLKEQRKAVVDAKKSLENEKSLALNNLESQQISSIEQQIASLNDSILSMDMNLTSSKLQLESVNSVDTQSKKQIAILTEKGNIAAEILNYQEKKEECESYLKSYDIQNNNCYIKANSSGFFYIGQELRTGLYVQEGTSVGTIYPEEESKYYSEIYVENSDIARLKKGQVVKFEIAAYPSSEYGYFTGTIENIAKDISIDQSTGQAYYIVRAKCDDITIVNENGEEASIINGLACQAKVVVDEKNVLSYLLEKIDLLD